MFPPLNISIIQTGLFGKDVPSHKESRNTTIKIIFVFVFDNSNIFQTSLSMCYTSGFIGIHQILQIIITSYYKITLIWYIKSKV